MFILFLSTAFAASLNSQCYDGNSCKACFELSQTLKGPRAALAKDKACKLGYSAACTPGPKVEIKKTESKIATIEAKPSSDSMKLKRVEVDRHLENLPALLQDAAMEERNPGFEFVQIEPKSVYETLGFKVGDILLEINGHAVESAIDASQMFVLMRDEKIFNVKFKRGGKTTARKYEITN